MTSQNDEAKAVRRDVPCRERTQETLALLEILALGNAQIEEGRVARAAEVIGRLRATKKRAR